MNPRRALLVLGKEVREALRDRRTLFVTLVLPVLLYPALMIGFGAVAARQKGKLREATQSWTFAGPVPADLVALLGAAPGLVRGEDGDPDAALREGKVHVVVRAEDGFAGKIASGGTGRLDLLYDSSQERSQEARRKVAEVVGAWESGILSARLSERGLEREFLDPVAVSSPQTGDVATAAKRGASVFGRMIAMMLVLMLLTGSFTPAVDLVAGEKERGTMETLLVSPATRLEIVVGKFLAVFALALLTAAGNLGSMAITFGQFSDVMGARERVDFHVGVGVLLLMLLAVIPLAALFSSLALALSALARSTKEAQTYLTPLLLVIMPLAMVSMVPNLDLTPGLASVPVAGAVLLFRDLMLAEGEPALLSKALAMLPIVVGVTALAAGLSLRWATWMFQREAVLVRDSGAPFSWQDLRPPRRAGSTPGPGGAALLPVICLAATYFIARALLRPESVGSPWAVALQQGILLGVVAAGLALARLDVRASLGLRAPGAGPLAAGLLLGVGAALATPWVHRLAGPAADAPGGAGAMIRALVLSLDPVTLVLLLAVLPAVAEEALFRGWCLRGLRREMSAAAAVLLSSAAFGVFHLEPDRIAFTGVLGCALGFLALRSGSLWPGILAHALHNGITVSLGRVVLLAEERTPAGPPPLDWVGGAAAGVAGLVLIALALVLASRSDATRASPET